MSTLIGLTEELEKQEEGLRAGGSEAGRRRQRGLGRLTVRDRLELLLDRHAPFLELGLWSAWQMYPEYGDIPAAGVVGGIGRVHGRPVLVIANDATVKAGAFFPQSVKKVLRAQRIAQLFRLPLLYLVDSAGVFLPLQDEIFPDEDDFGRIFRNNAVISAQGIPQYAAVMGNCVAGGAYLPVLCDKLLMTEGSQLYLAGPALVKAAIGQQVDAEELGGAAMHAALSGTVDFREADDPACLRRLRSLVELIRDPRTINRADDIGPATMATETERSPSELFELVSADGRREYDMRDVLRCIVDGNSLQEYKAEYGPTLVTCFAKIAGQAVGIVANQHRRSMTATRELQMGGVLYADGVEKGARFILDCNQTGLPIVFLQDVQGFMVGKQAEQSGIIRAGAKLVNAVANSNVPKFTVIVGGSFGAGNYALCGKAYDPWLILAWPNARYAVMGAHQAAETLLELKLRDAERKGEPQPTDEARREIYEQIETRYQEQTDIRYGAARGWVDAIIRPDQTRDWLSRVLRLLPVPTRDHELRTGVFQV